MLLLPVGGITLDNMAAYRAAGANGFGIGSSLYKPGMTAARVGAKTHNAGPPPGRDLDVPRPEKRQDQAYSASACRPMARSMRVCEGVDVHSNGDKK